MDKPDRAEELLEECRFWLNQKFLIWPDYWTPEYADFRSRLDDALETPEAGGK